MKLISNTGINRVIDALRQSFQSGASLDIATPFLSLFAFSELHDLLNHATEGRSHFGYPNFPTNYLENF